MTYGKILALIDGGTGSGAVLESAVRVGLQQVDAVPAVGVGELGAKARCAWDGTLPPGSSCCT